jgi:thiol-disulfide isomerase/thioredoxin
MKHTKLSLICLFILATSLYSQTYTVGDTVENFEFTDYSSGQTVSLHELGAEGGVLVLEWFAWWCPFCANAAANVETGILEHYGAMGGNNPNGVPVKHIALNVQGEPVRKATVSSSGTELKR